ncbi:hypothetical protein [Streptomyces sp. NPDC058758]|uniref:hypothetical protein n=1 Tax=Streptomyces sp. NPDC058758 TaxID=3346627 RepID=UPI003689E36C
MRLDLWEDRAIAKAITKATMGVKVNPTEQILNLTTTALDEFESVSLSASVRRAMRIARLMGDNEQAYLLSLDLRPVGGSAWLRRRNAEEYFSDGESSTARDRARELLEVYIEERTPVKIPDALTGIIEQGSVLSGPISVLEMAIDEMVKSAEVEEDPLDKLRFALRIDLQNQILERIRHRTFSYLCSVETKIGIGFANREIFERSRSRVEEALRGIAPDVLEQLLAAYRRAADGDAESRSHALTSCRRMLESLANVVYPPKSEPVKDRAGKERQAGADKYKNRLWLFLDEKVGSRTSGAVVMATLEDVGNRIDKAYELANKGVHADVSMREVDLCVIQSYLIAGELISLMSEGDGTNQPVEPHTS